MMRSELCEDNPSVNIVTQSGIATSEDKVEGTQLVLYTRVCRVGEKNIGFELQRENDILMEERIFFMDLGAYTYKTQKQIVP